MVPVPVLEALGDRAEDARDAAPPHGLAVGGEDEPPERLASLGIGVPHESRQHVGVDALDDPELGIDPRRDPFQRGERAKDPREVRREPKLERVQRRAELRHDTEEIVRPANGVRVRLSRHAVENLRQRVRRARLVDVARQKLELDQVAHERARVAVDEPDEPSEHGAPPPRVHGDGHAEVQVRQRAGVRVHDQVPGVRVRVHESRLQELV